jgi:electron transport complex protein RnfC
VLVGIEADKLAAKWWLDVAAHGDTQREMPVDVVPCEVHYPQGAERQLVTALTGRVVPARALPSAVGVLVQNVATAASVYEAVRWRRPLLDRVMTVSGPGIKVPRNLRVPIGTLLGEVVAFCGGMDPDTTRVVAGGPMMGRSLPRLDVPVIKGMNGLVLLKGRGPFEDGFGPCIQCGRCLEAGRPLDTEPYGAIDCYECGSCSYACPSHRPLVQFMQVAKSALRRASELRVAS